MIGKVKKISSELTFEIKNGLKKLETHAWMIVHSKIITIFVLNKMHLSHDMVNFHFILTISFK